MYKIDRRGGGGRRVQKSFSRTDPKSVLNNLELEINLKYNYQATIQTS